jgi:hypothetical protein
LGVEEEFGPKRDEVTGKCRKLRNEELHYLYSSPRRKKERKKKKLANSIAMYGQGRELFRPPTYYKKLHNLHGIPHIVRIVNLKGLQ